LEALTGGPAWAFVVAGGGLSLLLVLLGGLTTVVWTNVWQVSSKVVFALVSLFVIPLLYHKSVHLNDMDDNLCVKTISSF
jgi:Na+/proline symporter